MEAAHVVGLEVPAKGTLELPVGSDLDGGGCLAALQGVSGPPNGGGELVVDGICMASRFPVTLAHCHHTAIWILHCPHTADAAVPVGMLSPPLWVGCCSGLKFLELLL